MTHLARAILLSVLLVSSSYGRGKPALEQFGTASDGTPLHWLVKTPSTPGPWPAVLAIHGGGFVAGDPNTPMRVCGTDLANAGYIVFSPEYRLAPPGHIAGQTTDGRYPQQTDDVAVAIAAARTDPRANGELYGVGGSGGGYEVAYAAAQGLIDAGVSLSGVTNLADAQSRAENPNFKQLGDNYAPNELDIASPINHLGATSVPVYFFNETNEAMPLSQLTDAVAAWKANGTPESDLIMTGTLHAFAYWPQVNSLAIDWLGAHRVGGRY